MKKDWSIPTLEINGLQSQYLLADSFEFDPSVPDQDYDPLVANVD